MDFLNAEGNSQEALNDEQREALDLLLCETPNQSEERKKRKIAFSPEVKENLKAMVDAMVEERLGEMRNTISDLRTEIDLLKTEINGRIDNSLHTTTDTQAAIDGIKATQVSFADSVKKNEEKLAAIELAAPTDASKLPGNPEMECKMEAMEQYSRRECLRIYGLSEDENENTRQKVLETVWAMGININESDISMSHRLPVRNLREGEPKPVLVKFMRHDLKKAIYSNKSCLRRSVHHYNVYVREHLTKERSRAVFTLKSTGFSVDTEDGRLITTKNKTVCYINNLYDMCGKLGWEQAAIRKLFSKPAI